MESVDIVIKAVNQAKTALGEVGRDLKGVGQEAKKLDKDTSRQAVIGLRQWQSELKKTQKNVQSLRDASQGIVDVSKKLLMAGVAMGAAVFFPIKQAGEFESAMAKVKAIMTDISEETFERMKAQARSLGETTQYTATQSAEAFVFLAMAGLNAIEAMEALPGTLQLAAAGGLDLAEAADLATNVLAGLGFQVDQLGRVNDVLARAASRANTSVRELGEAMKIAGPAAKGSKEEFEAIVAVLGGMADAGIKGGEAGNAVKRMLILLQNPTAKARVELERLNVPLTDSEGKFRGLIPILRDLGEAQMDLSASAKIFGLYTGAAAIAASGQAEKMGRLTKELRNAKGAAEEMAKVMLDTLPGALTLLKSAVEGLMLAVASPLMGMLKEIVGAIAEMVSMVTALVKATGPVAPMLLGLVTILAGMALSVGALGMVVGGLIYGFAQWTVAMKMITPTLMLIRGAVIANIASMTTLKGAVGLLKNAFLALLRVIIAHPVIAFAAALAAVYVYIKQLTPEWEKLNEKATKLRTEVGKLKSSFEEVCGAFEKTIKGSDKQIAAAAKLKDKLIELAKENENVSGAALKAADSIERGTGKIIDEGKALKEFKLAIVRQEFEMMAATAVAASAKMEAAMDRVKYPMPTLKTYIALLKDMGSTMLYAMPTVDSLRRHMTDLGEQSEKAMKEGRVAAADLIQELIKLRLVDPSLGMRQFETYIKSLGPLSEEMTQYYLYAWAKIKVAQAKAAKAGTDIVKRSLDEQNILLQKQANDQEAILLRLTQKHKEAQKAAEIDPSNIAAIEAQGEAYRKSFEVIDTYVEAVKALRDNEIALAQEASNAKIQIIEDEVARKITTKKQGELEIARIIAEGAKAEADILMAAADRVAKTMGKGAEAYSKMSAVAKKAANEAYTAQAEALDKYAEKLRQTYENARNEVEKYAKEVIRWNDKIAELSMSTEDKIRNVKRKTMSEYNQWLDKRRQAEEKLQAARAALEEGNFALAEKLARQAESLYGDLAAEVKEGVGEQQKIVVSIGEGARAAVEGYGTVKTVLEDIYKVQRDIAEDTKTQWEDTVSIIQSALEGITERRIEIGFRLKDVVAVESEIEKLTRDRKVYITPVVKEMVGGFIKKFASGGHLPGYGGGDRVGALLEAGEFVIRKEAVRKYGSWFFNLWNSMKLKASDIGPAITSRLSSLQPHAQLGYQMGGQVSALPDMGRLELVVGSAAYPVIADLDVIGELKKAVERERLMRTN